MINVIGDVHGKVKSYFELIKNKEHTVQLGDLGFSYEFLKNVDHNKHKFIGGNHDNWDILEESPPLNYLGRYGYANLNGVNFFFVSGAFSIDRNHRIINDTVNKTKSWWNHEELSFKEGLDCLSSYEKIKPEIVLSHDCPTEISKMVGHPNTLKAWGFNPDNFRTSTQQLLQQCFDIHRPKRWVFGHYHTSFDKTIKECRFQCLDELRHTNI